MQAVRSSEDDIPGAVDAAAVNSDGLDDEVGSPVAVSGASEDTEASTAEQEPQSLVLWQGVALLTADCLGVGVLALPNDIQTLGLGWGLGFLLANFPINFYAGDLLSVMALQLERGVLRPGMHRYSTTGSGGDDENDDLHLHEDNVDDDAKEKSKDEIELTRSSAATDQTNQQAPSSTSTSTSTGTTMVHRRKSGQTYSDLPHSASVARSPPHQDQTIGELPNAISEDTFEDEIVASEIDETPVPLTAKTALTSDLIGISQAVFHHPRITQLVLIVYYLNLFLVLGDYLLVMGRAVSALFLDQICLPTAGAIASVLMFGISQFRTMAHLGRNVSLASLIAMFIVLLQCLFHHRTSGNETVLPVTDDTDAVPDIWAKFSAIASIGFAVGSQKLFLNIRHELQHREQASKVLAGSLTSYGLAYLLVIALAGPHPPSFLFDAIPEGWSRRIAGLLLWGHVAVSYAINSQALCSSMDRCLMASLTGHDNATQAQSWWTGAHPQARWFILTLTVTISSYLVSNAVPFFKDLVALIGALTSVPLTLTLPALLHRHFHHFSVLWPSRVSLGSYSLLTYSLCFLGVGLVGALSSIDEDWLNHGSPFSCQ